MNVSGLRPAARLAAQLLAATVVAALLVDAGLRFFPRRAPPRLQLDLLRWEFRTEVLSGDPEIGVVVHAPFERRIVWQGKTVKVRHHLFAGESAVGYRAGAEGGDPTNVDVAVLGDSHAYNLEMDEDATWLSLLSRSAGLSVANLALPYQGTAQEMLWYRRYGARFHPKLVLMLVCPNDAWDNKVFHDWTAQSYGRGLDYRLYKFQALLGWPEPFATLAYWSQRSFLVYELLFTRRMGWRYESLNEKAIRAPEGIEGLVADVAATRALAGADGARFAAVLTDIWWADPYGPLRAPFKNSLRSRGIPVLDLAKSLCAPAGCPTELALPNDRHWNEAGQARVAAEIQRFLLEERMLPPRKKTPGAR